MGTIKTPKEKRIEINLSGKFRTIVTKNKKRTKHNSVANFELKKNENLQPHHSDKHRCCVVYANKVQSHSSEREWGVM